MYGPVGSICIGYLIPSFVFIVTMRLMSLQEDVYIFFCKTMMTFFYIYSVYIDDHSCLCGFFLWL
jgi:hypothetical protein